jgi:undecaprenyl-diphosphatase
MPDWIGVILLGIIEGITEFIPISSTGHMIIAEHWLPKQSDLFKIVIQSGAVLAVLPLFPERLRQFTTGWRQKETQDYLLKILVAFVITGVGGLILEKNDFKLPDQPWPIAIALFVGGVAFLLIERHLRKRELSARITWAVVLAVGIGQLVAAVFPGASRSGTTIVAALLLGLNRSLATEFSFLVGIPTMLAAGGYKLLKAFRAPEGPQEDWGLLVLGFLTGAAVSFLAVRWLLRYVQTHTFELFGWYRIGLAILLLLLLKAGF